MRDNPHEVLSMYTIYWNPRDYPMQYVVRRWSATQEGQALPCELLGLAGSLIEARSFLPHGLYPLGRSPEDDPCIVETWV